VSRAVIATNVPVSGLLSPSGNEVLAGELLDRITLEI
jgi:hypothetical protein